MRVFEVCRVRVSGSGGDPGEPLWRHRETRFRFFNELGINLPLPEPEIPEGNLGRRELFPHPILISHRVPDPRHTAKRPEKDEGVAGVRFEIGVSRLTRVPFVAPETHEHCVREARLICTPLRLLPDGRAALHLQLLTGRTHQIRVQLGSRGCPVCGDRKYGAQAAPGGIQLYAWRLRVPHPDGRSLTFCLPEELLPPELQGLAEDL